MERIAAILVIFVLLMNGRHVERRLPQEPIAMTIVAEPLPHDDDATERTMLGPLVWLGGWDLKASRPDFGGTSSMQIDERGNMVALSDNGEVTVFRPGVPSSSATLMPVPAFDFEIGSPKWRWDTESMTHDPATGQLWVGFELVNRICRYSRDFARIERCASPAAIADWPQSRGMESLTRLPDGRFLAIAEDQPGTGGGHEVVLFPGDPVDPVTQPPLRLSYSAPRGYLPTDALAIGNGRMLVLNRRVTLLSGFTAVLSIVDISDLRPGTVLRGTVVARFTAPLPHDNFEALATSLEGNRHVLWVASDDNHLFFQRSLLLKFAMPADWFAPRAESR